jgi:hypothetical protein
MLALMSQMMLKVSSYLTEQQSVVRFFMLSQKEERLAAEAKPRLTLAMQH